MRARRRGGLYCWWTVVVVAASCTPRHHVLESAVATRGSRVWVAGTEGFAGYYDLMHGSFSFVRVDYPRARERFRGAYASFLDIPAARVVDDAGETYLFTRMAELLRWDGARWSSRPLRLPSGAGSSAQLDVVLRAPDGRLLVQLHHATLLWSTPAQLASGRYEVEATPTYFSELAFVGAGVLYGIGHDDAGQVPVLRRREGPGNWPVVAPLPGHLSSDSLLGIVDAGGGVPAVVAGEGLFVLDGRELVLSSVAERLRRTGQSPGSSGGGTPRLSRVIPLAGGAPLLQVSGSVPGLLGSLDGQEVFWSCDVPNLVASVVVHSRLWVLTSRGAVLALESGRCRVIHRDELEP